MKCPICNEEFDENRLTYHYDSKYDTMYISVGPKGSGVTEKNKNILVRRDVINKRILGITVLNYSKNSKELLDALTPKMFDEKDFPNLDDDPQFLCPDCGTSHIGRSIEKCKKCGNLRFVYIKPE